MPLAQLMAIRGLPNRLIGSDLQTDENFTMIQRAWRGPDSAVKDQSKITEWWNLGTRVLYGSSLPYQRSISGIEDCKDHSKNNSQVLRISTIPRTELDGAATSQSCLGTFRLLFISIGFVCISIYRTPHVRIIWKSTYKCTHNLHSMWFWSLQYSRRVVMWAVFEHDNNIVSASSQHCTAPITSQLGMAKEETLSSLCPRSRRWSVWWESVLRNEESLLFFRHSYSQPRLISLRRSAMNGMTPPGSIAFTAMTRTGKSVYNRFCAGRFS